MRKFNEIKFKFAKNGLKFIRIELKFIKKKLILKMRKYKMS